MSRPRDNFFEDVAPALRELVSRAIDTDAVRGRSRVLLAVLYLTASYSRLGDRLYVDQVAAVAKLPGDADGSHCRRALRELAEMGVIEYHGGRGTGRSSWISIRPSSDRAHPLMAPVRSPERGQQWPGTGAASGPQKGASSGPLPSRSFEKNGEESNVAAAGELDDLLRRFPEPLWPVQRARCVEAYSENPAGFLLAYEDAVRADVASKAALLDSMIARGVHRTSAPATPFDEAERWIRVTAWQFQDDVVVDELGYRWPQIDESDRDRLRHLAIELRESRRQDVA